MIAGQDTVPGLAPFRLMHVVAFARVVDAHGFTAAARQLGMSKATVSKHVTMLEAHLGTRLLNRTTRSLGLTEDGARFYAHCRNILAELASAETELLQAGASPRGRLRVNAPTFFGSRRLAPALYDFLESYPELEVELTLCDEEDDLVAVGMDVAIRVSREPEAGTRATRLAPCAMVVCGAPRYLERYGAPAVPGDLVRHNCLSYVPSPDADVWCLDGPTGEARIKVRGRFRANDAEALRSAVLSGFGLALMPTLQVAEDLRAGDLVEVLPGYQARSHSIYVIHPNGGQVPAKTRAFIGFLEARCRGGRAWV